MKIKDTYILRKIAGDFVVVPTGEAADKVQGVIQLSETGAFIWECLKEDQTVESLVKEVTSKYNIDADTAKADIVDFLHNIQHIGCLAE